MLTQRPLQVRTPTVVQLDLATGAVHRLASPPGAATDLTAPARWVYAPHPDGCGVWAIDRGDARGGRGDRPVQAVRVGRRPSAIVASGAGTGSTAVRGEP
jgi:hypothetical protein